MFTIKYRTYNPSSQQPQDGPVIYDACEQIHGPFTMISQEIADGYQVVYAHNGDDPGMTFGPHRQDSAGGMRPTIWVMNDTGATVARYDL